MWNTDRVGAIPARLAFSGMPPSCAQSARPQRLRAGSPGAGPPVPRSGSKPSRVFGHGDWSRHEPLPRPVDGGAPRRGWAPGIILPAVVGVAASIVYCLALLRRPEEPAAAAA